MCPTEITAFSDRHKEFKELNTEVLGVSVDSQFTHLAWIQTDRKEGGLGDLAYPLVADLKKEISKAYGVLTEDGIALRGLFIIDKEGIVQHATINNLGFGRSVDETKRVLQAIQYIQNNPDEVCPAGWKPGDKTMKPDPKVRLNKGRQHMSHDLPVFAASFGIHAYSLRPNCVRVARGGGAGIVTVLRWGQMRSVWHMLQAVAKYAAV